MNRRGLFRALLSAPFLTVAAPVGLLGASFAANALGVNLAPAQLGLVTTKLLSTLTPPPIKPARLNRLEFDPQDIPVGSVITVTAIDEDGANYTIDQPDGGVIIGLQFFS